MKCYSCGLLNTLHHLLVKNNKGKEGRHKLSTPKKERGLIGEKEVRLIREGVLNPFAPGDFAEKRVLKLVEWFSGHCHAIKS